MSQRSRRTGRGTDLGCGKARENHIAQEGELEPGKSPSKLGFEYSHMELLKFQAKHLES
jgi:hypothetical protein